MTVTTVPYEENNVYNDEKKDDVYAQVTVTGPDEGDVHMGEKHEHHLNKDIQATAEELAEMEEKVSTMSLERCRAIMEQVYKSHRYDQNFPSITLEKIEQLLHDPDVISKPENYSELVHEMKLEALLVTENSPYAEVRAVVDAFDDPELPVLTFRVWFIGCLFSGAGAFVNQLFSIRQPAVSVSSDVAQILAYPFGKFLAKVLPTATFNIPFFGRHSLNPGPFNRKEHMLITVMCTVAFHTPYTGNIVMTQAMPQWFNQSYARSYGYQLLNTLGSNFIGYGIAGLCRRFIVYPSFCVWPTSLTTLALNKAFHSDTESVVPGPFRRIYTWSRMKLFYIAFAAMFVWFWFPSFIFQALSNFNWIPWIAPENVVLTAITGQIGGLGLNPWPTFDWNMSNFTPLVLPQFAVMNQFLGMCIGFFLIIAVWFSNAWNTSYLPINSNGTFANTGKRYKVINILNDKGGFDMAKFQAYSEPWMCAGNIMLYFFFFMQYTATVSYTALFHRHELAMGFRGFWADLKRNMGRGNAEGEEDVDHLAEDIHYRLMKQYSEVPEWWYLLVLLFSVGAGVAGLAAYPTNTSPAIALYGLLLAFIFVIPIGLVMAVTGTPVTLNVIAEFIGGIITPGEALSMNYFKMYGYITTQHAIDFCKDLKLAHYSKIPPKFTFWAQLVATFISSIVCTSIYNFQMDLDGVCTPDATFKFKCPGQNTFFTASVFWGTIGPTRLFAKGGRYSMILLGFPIGFVLPFISWGLQKQFPRARVFRALHPVMIANGGIQWAPYNFAYYWPGTVLTFISWSFVKKRYLAFWAKYNYILAAAFGTGCAVAAVIIFFTMEVPGLSLEWWGNAAEVETGCEAVGGCPLLAMPEKGYFGAAPGTFL